MDFDETVGQVFGFYGVDANRFKIGRTVFEALEDDCDGYRSLLGSVEVKDPSRCIFFRQAIASVRVERVDYKDFEGYRLVDVGDGHCWLRLGTDRVDDYYPCFIFDYAPKRP